MGRYKVKKKIIAQQGFTLVELLVTMAIIGILSSIAVPQIASYRAKAYDSHAELGLRMVAVAEIAYFSESSGYLSCDQSNCESLLVGVDRLDQGIMLDITGTASGFTGTSTHQRGTGKVFSWPR